MINIPYFEAHEIDAGRRSLLKSGGIIIGAGFLGGCQSTVTGIMPLVTAAAKIVNGGDKPTYVAQAKDPLSYSLADSLFWNDILMEHAMFFVMLMPGADLAGPRRQAEEFQNLFARQLELSKTMNRDNYVTINRSTIDLAQRFSDYKRRMKEEQQAGRLMSLVWPLFFEHTAREADRFSKRLALYSKGEIEFDRQEVITFWSRIMSEHSGFIAHLLDPQEKVLFDQASKLEKAFAQPAALQPANAAISDPIMKAAHEILDFKTVAEKGIKSGIIKSIIRPELADHVRREAARFIDELKRAT